MGLVALLVCLLPAGALAQAKATLALDNFSVLYFEGAGVPMTFTFSTESMSASAKGHMVTRQGERLDPASGYLQLVTAGINPDHAATAPGEPFYAVLSGRVLGFTFQ